MPRSSQFAICSLCNEPIELETAKTDEKGNAVHEECYVLETQLQRTWMLRQGPRIKCARRLTSMLPNSLAHQEAQKELIF
jgi:hypothetical protein